jgi:hypothetical protein
VLPNLAAKDKHEFSIGQDSEVTYTENITLVSSEQVREAETPNSTVVVYRTRSIYKIDVQVTNFKTRSMKVEYKQLFTYSYNIFKLELIKSTNDICVRDNLSIICKLALDAGDEYIYSYTVELVGQ